MELPHIGANCALRQCNRLDFLPVKCDACHQVFCVQHYPYDAHQCDKAQNKNVQVPVCPLCNEPVTSKRGELPDIAVSQHIDQYCSQNASIKNPLKPRTNLQACSMGSCKQKDVIYLECSDCSKKFCVKHRHPSDHACKKPSVVESLASNWQSLKSSSSTSASSSFDVIRMKAQQISKSGQAAMSRLAKSLMPNTSRGHATPSSARRPDCQASSFEALQGNLNEQEALAIAINESRAAESRPTASNKATSRPATSQRGDRTTEEDLELARAIHESQLEAESRR